jgi:hypothetical protein
VTYPFVPAFHDYGIAKGPRKAFVIHMAEGGGTVGYLSRRNPNGVSVHYVIERSGRIVQMLLESHAGGHVNPADIRTTEGPPPYGAKVRKEVMGTWDRDPNSATLAVEIEGFAKDGPNPDQELALIRLTDDIRTRHPDIGLLGHRDFQDYKACPGVHIDWASIGGHGPAQELDMPGLDLRPIGTLVAGTVDIPNGTEVIYSKDRRRRNLSQAATNRQATGLYDRADFAGDQPGYEVQFIDGMAWVREDACTFTPAAGTGSYLVTVGGKLVGEVVLP